MSPSWSEERFCRANDGCGECWDVCLLLMSGLGLVVVFTVWCTRSEGLGVCIGEASDTMGGDVLLSSSSGHSSKLRNWNLQKVERKGGNELVRMCEYNNYNFCSLLNYAW